MQVRRFRTGREEAEHLRAAGDWLRAAQDSQPDGGVAGRYSLTRGWSSSYPETTGYLIPTLLRLGDELGTPELKERAGRCVRFLLGVQLPSGAFPGLEIADNRTEPSVFNTAQILCGLDAWHREADDEETLAAARRAAEWLVDVQDEDGAWRRHTYAGGARTYYAHAGCWLARFGSRSGEDRYLRAAGANLDWVLSRQDRDTGWFHGSGFEVGAAKGRAVTHGIGYTLWGVLETSARLGRDDGHRAVRRASAELARRVLEWGRLPGELGRGWEPLAGYACLTGNAQIAQVWRRLDAAEGRPAMAEAAQVALEPVKAGQVLSTREPGLRGGVPGSTPLWGDYLPFTLPCWAPKFFVDALLEG